MKISLKILLWVVMLVLLIKFLTIIFAEPWVREKTVTALNAKFRDYIIEIDKVHILFLTSGIKLESITIDSSKENEGEQYLNGKIGSIKFKGINLIKAIFKKEIDISEVAITNSNIKGKFPFSRKSKPAIILPLNIRTGRIILDKTDLAIKNSLNAQSYSVKEGFLKMYDLQVGKRDTLSPGIINKFDFEAKELASVTPDSMYSLTAGGISYSVTTNILVADSFSIQPNYTDYDFTSRFKFQTNRFEAAFSNIYFYDFYAADYVTSGNLISSSIEIGKIDMTIFRDKRKEFRHVNKPAFQDLIYNYPGKIQIDSICLSTGDITYKEHAEKANEPGSISFNEINAEVYNITNDTICKTESIFLELKGDALLMEKGKMTVLLKARIFDSHNTFSLDGTLSALEASELNPILEKSAFIYATSGKIDAMNYNFTANNARATGKMKMLYRGLDIAVKNKRTDDTTAFIQRLVSLVVNRKLLDSNPIPGEKVREGIIDYERDPEKFLIGYCFKSIMSGIKSSLIKGPKK